MSYQKPMFLKKLVQKYKQGLLLASLIGSAAAFLSEHYAAPMMLFALLLGMAFHSLAKDERFEPGINFASKGLLRIGVALLGAKITFENILALGLTAIVSVAVFLIFTILMGFLVGKYLMKDWRFGVLTSGSVAICGASAALALTAILPKGSNDERDTLFTVASVTVLSTIAMVLYPLLFAWFGFDDQQKGFLIGATVHDVAQVVGAGYSISVASGDTATLTKLLRVSILPVVLFILLIITPKSQDSGKSKIQIPTFLFGFIVLMVLSSLNFIPTNILEILQTISRVFLVIAISALGVKTSLTVFAGLSKPHLFLVLWETVFLLILAIITVFLGI